MTAERRSGFLKAHDIPPIDEPGRASSLSEQVASLESERDRLLMLCVEIIGTLSLPQNLDKRIDKLHDDGGSRSLVRYWRQRMESRHDQP